jgi:serine phosphatase RsbU (regulator of sigma subunit)
MDLVGGLGDPLAMEPASSGPGVEPPPGLAVAALFADISRELHRDGDPQATLQRIVELAVVSVPGAEHAAITTVAGLAFTTVVATDELPMRVDQVQYETREGPCVDSLLSHEVYRANDLASDVRFPTFAPLAVARTGVRSMLAFRLFTQEGSLGALNMYSTKVGSFTSASLAMGALFAAHASVAMRTAQDADDREELSADQEISMAVGILMACTGDSEDEARRLLAQVAGERSVEVHSVAAEVVESRQPPAQDDVAAGDPAPVPTAHGSAPSLGWSRADHWTFLAALAGLCLGLGLIWAFSSSPTQRPIAVLLVPVLGVALGASVWVTASVALVAVSAGGVLFLTGDPTSADLRLRFGALLVGAALAVVFAGVRQRREQQLREHVAASSVARARAETERILSAMLSRLPELDAAADVQGVALRACSLGRELFGADHVSYWQVEGLDCVLVCRDPGEEIPAGTHVPRHLFASGGPDHPERTRTVWIRADDVIIPTAGQSQARATEARVGTSTPIQVAGQTVAYLGMSWTHPREEPDRSWLDAVDRFADQVALSKTVIRRRLAQRETVSLAQRFQAGMLPRIPDQELLTVRSLYRPGSHHMLLGGDFLDVATSHEGTLSFVLGDVSGHGPEQAALGATLRGAWLSVASIPHLGPQDWARALNDVVHRLAPHAGVFVTAVMGQINPSARTLTYVTAGHPPPILLRPGVSGAPLGDTVLGPFPGTQFTLHHVDLPEHWAVLVVTDGLFEGHLPGSRTSRGDYDQFLDHLRDLTGDVTDPSWLSDLADSLEHANDGPLSDDAAALLLTPRGDRPYG